MKPESDPDKVIEAPEGHPRQFVGMIVNFDMRRKGGVITRERGEITDQKYLGVTERGAIPEYEVIILGNSGMAVRARVTRDHIQPV